jgi:type I restriction enzyme M protein
VRKKLIEENRLDAVVSMPSGVFRPYAGVSTAVLVFTKGAATDKIWFYDMEHDGFSLDDKRQKVAENDIPDLLECWRKRKDVKFQQKRTQRLADLQKQVAPLKADRMQHHATIHRLRFEEVIADGRASRRKPDVTAEEEARLAREQAEAELAELQAKIAPLQQEINQLSRQFWVSKDQAKANNYDLSASRYRQVEQDDLFFESPELTLSRLRELERVAGTEVQEIVQLLRK